MRVKFSLFHVFFIKVGVIIHTHTHKHFLCFHWRSDTNPNKENPSRNALIIFLIMPTVPRGLDSRPGIICLHIPCRIVRRSVIHSPTPPKEEKKPFASTYIQNITPDEERTLLFPPWWRRMCGYEGASFHAPMITGQRAHTAGKRGGGFISTIKKKNMIERESWMFGRNV